MAYSAKQGHPYSSPQIKGYYHQKRASTKQSRPLHSTPSPTRPPPPKANTTQHSPLRQSQSALHHTTNHSATTRQEHPLDSTAQPTLKFHPPQSALTPRQISPMHILVDFDNIAPLTRSGPLLKAVDTIFDAAKPTLSTTTRVQVRLYGGWYEEQGPTRRAQQLAADVAANFPHAINIDTAPQPLRVQVELAYSLLAEPKRHLLHTYREKKPPQALRSREPTEAGCMDSSCALSGIAKLIKSGRCPATTCTIKTKDLLYKAEQKLVDSMITADLVYLATHGDKEPTIVVCSDDDIWPGVRTAIQLGAAILHIRSPDNASQADYHSDLGAGYQSTWMKNNGH